jgi:hypothetical protein
MIPIGIMAFGMGFGMSQRTSIIASAVPIQEVGSASSVLALARNIAGAFGIAILGTILQNATYSYMSQTVQNSILNIHTPQNVKTFIALMILKSQVLAYDYVFFIASITLTVGAIGAYWIKVDKEIKAEVYVE